MTLPFVMSCAVGPVPTPSANCIGWEPLFMTPADVDLISPQLALGVAQHNTFGARLGCWKRPQAVIEPREEAILR